MKNTFILLVFIFLFFQNCKTDDITNEFNECPRNVDIGLKALSENSATIKWLETQGFASNYEYGEKGFKLGTGLKGYTADENILLQNLKPQTEYDFYLQSVCSAEVTGEIIANPYRFTTLTCYDLSSNKISIIGYVEDGGFQLNWIPERNAEEWQVAMLVNSINTPTDEDIYNTEGVKSFTFTNIQPDTQYKFFVRGKCNGKFEEWVTKEINPGDPNLYSPCLARVQNISSISGFVNFSVLTSGTYLVEIVEENTEKGTGILLDQTDGNIYIGNFHNEYPGYSKSNTKYDIFIRLKCGSSYSLYTKIITFKTP